MQLRLSRGILDAYVPLKYPVLIEIKLTQTPDAYYQLNKYAVDFPKDVIRCLITKTVVLTIITPELPVYLPKIADLANAQPGYYVIPYAARR